MELLLRQEEVYPDQLDTTYSRAPLWWPAWSEHEGVERKDLRTSMPDKESQIPLSLALSNGHSRVVKIILEWTNANSTTANHVAMHHFRRLLYMEANAL